MSGRYRLHQTLAAALLVAADGAAA
jgi:hypothetical protein